jgi:hypothetical protein
MPDAKLQPVVDQAWARGAKPRFLVDAQLTGYNEMVYQSTVDI